MSDVVERVTAMLREQCDFPQPCGTCPREAERIVAAVREADAAMLRAEADKERAAWLADTRGPVADVHRERTDRYREAAALIEAQGKRE